MTEYKKGYAPDIFTAANSLKDKSPTAETVERVAHKEPLPKTTDIISKVIGYVKGGAHE